MHLPPDAWSPCGLGSMSAERIAGYVEALRTTIPECSGHGSDATGAWWFTSGHRALTTTLWLRAAGPEWNPQAPLSYAVEGSPEKVRAERSRWDRLIGEADRAAVFGAAVFAGAGSALTTSLHITYDSVADEHVWVSAVDGSLVVVPDSAVPGWTGLPEIPAGPAGVVEAGGVRALVLAGRGATCYLPEHRLFVRWLQADSEAGLIESALSALRDPATEWEDCGTWEVTGPAVLMDPAFPAPRQAPVAIAAGHWTVRASSAGLVRLQHGAES